MRCRICDSVLHLQKDCPHSYENLGRVYLTEELSADIILFTGSIKQEMCLLTYEARNAAVLDSACTSTVAGTVWVDCFIDSLSDEEKSKVIRRPSSKRFKFGGGEKMRSKETIEFPSILAGKSIMIRPDVVDSDISLLLSKDSMKKAKIKLDLENDQSRNFWRNY